MRIVLLFILGVGIWAGTISLKYPQQSSTVTASSGQICSGESDGEKLMAYLKTGTIINIQDNGKTLTIGLSPKWVDLSAKVQRQVYDTVACYAQSQHRQIHFLVIHQV